MDADWIIRQFADCSIAWGYCHGSGKAERAEPFRIDLQNLTVALRSVAHDANDRLLRLMHSHYSPWVQHSCAIALLDSHPSEAEPMLERLSVEDGVWSLFSQVALSAWRQGLKR